MNALLRYSLILRQGLPISVCIVALHLLIGGGCGTPAIRKCETVRDCLGNEECRQGTCQVIVSNELPNTDGGQSLDQKSYSEPGQPPDSPTNNDHPSVRDNPPPKDDEPPRDTPVTPPPSGSRFASQAGNWRVPIARFCRATYANRSEQWTTLDIDGDKRPDLVWTSDPNTGKAFASGGAHWKVFKNTGSRFASQATHWKVPGPAFDQVSYAYRENQWSTFDIDGDGKPDLVWTSDPNTGKAFASGGAHWKVFKNTGSGFATQATIWKVPGPAFDQVAYSYRENQWSTFDIDGDKRPDLVWTADPNTGKAFASGGAHWKVFKNTGNGFVSQSLTWKVPIVGFYQVAYSYRENQWSTFDIDGDKKPDLVWTTDPNTGKAFASGGTHWKVFKNTGNGFAVQSVAWKVPIVGFFQVSYSYRENQWSTFDIDGDKRPDLVWTADPNTGKAFASDGAHWKVFKNAGSGFATQATSWKVPTTGFSRTAYSSGGEQWSTFDIDGDKKPDLVWTANPAVSSCTTFSSGGIHWRWFRNE